MFIPKDSNTQLTSNKVQKCIPRVGDVECIRGAKRPGAELTKEGVKCQVTWSSRVHMTCLIQQLLTYLLTRGELPRRRLFDIAQHRS